MSILLTCIYNMYTTYVIVAYGSQKRALELLELELHMIVSCSAENQTLDFYKNSKCS